MESVNGRSQKEVSKWIEDRRYEGLLVTAESARDKAHLNSVALPHAGDWLQVVPSAALGLQLRTPEFRTSVLYRLGMPVFRTEGNCVSC